MSYEGILDTNLFLRYLHDGSKEQREKFKALIGKAHRNGTLFFVPSVVIMEMVYVLERVYRLPKSRVRELVESIFSLPIEVENSSILLKALALYEEENLKFGDALLLSYARELGITPIYTLDAQDFERFEEARVL